MWAESQTRRVSWALLVLPPPPVPSLPPSLSLRPFSCSLPLLEPEEPRRPLRVARSGEHFKALLAGAGRGLSAASRGSQASLRLREAAGRRGAGHSKVQTWLFLRKTSLGWTGKGGPTSPKFFFPLFLSQDFCPLGRNVPAHLPPFRSFCSWGRWSV